jgi:uncharacterized caspase-like protein/tetratricopeptide (TPR) repeat protein
MFRTLCLVGLFTAVCLTPTATPARGDDGKPGASKPANPADVKAEPAPAGRPRGDAIPDGPGVNDGMKYARRWAVFIGANYTDRNAKWALKNAENDATAVHALLTGCYGFPSNSFWTKPPEEVRLFLGDRDRWGSQAASKANLERVLGNEFLTSDRIGENDCVFVFFSGHGYLQDEGRIGSRTGYLFPSDFAVTKSAGGDEQPSTGTLIKVQDVVAALKTCKARHKLLVLDCCHSGTVFRVEEGTKDLRHERSGESREGFAARGFQAITAGLETQKVPDGTAAAGHSPFTTALLRGLTTIPQLKKNWGTVFTASDLYRQLEADLHSSQAGRQSPECRSIGGDPGEFHFFPDLTSPYWPRDDRVLSEVARQQLLAIVPSTLGNWWADDMIWFMPGLRYQMLARKEKTKSVENYFSLDAVRDVALTMAAEHRKEKQDREKAKEPQAAAGDYRYDLLDRLLKASGLAERNDAIDAAIAKLEELDQDESGNTENAKRSLTDRVLDTHYLAVLCQKRGSRTAEAERYYLKALEGYEQLKTDSKLRPLHALCLTDYGILCLSGLQKFDEAVRRFDRARSVEVVGPEAPAAFAVFALSKEAEAWRRLGLFPVSDKKLSAAEMRMLEADPKRVEPMTAGLYKMNAWALMEQCRFEEAREWFRKSGDCLARLKESHPANPQPYEVELLHVRHGQAMIERFQGRDEDAIKLFRELTDQIGRAFRDLDTREEQLANRAEIRQQLAERYVNSVDRQGDCRLYGRIPDYAEAADDYRRALRAVGHIPEDRREWVTLDLLYRRAIALAMPSPAQNPAQNLRVAQELCKEAADLELHLETKHKVKSLPRKTMINKAIALTLVRCPKVTGDNELLKLVRPRLHPDTAVAGKVESPQVVTLSDRSLDRDEIERIMFGCVLLLRNREVWGLSELDTQSCCDQLLTACRAATRALRRVRDQELIDSGLLAYLRPYYDEAFRFKAGQTPAPVKELVEIAWEATRGTTYRKPKELAPVLVYYRTALQGCPPQGYFLLDVTATKDQPGGVTQCFPLGKEWCDEALLKQASLAGGILPLPEKLSGTLAGLKLDRPLEGRWRDPVSGLGMPPASPKNLASWNLFGTPIVVSVSGQDPVGPTLRFPFHLGSSFPAERFSDLAELANLGLPSSRKADALTERIPSPTPPIPMLRQP